MHLFVKYQGVYESDGVEFSDVKIDDLAPGSTSLIPLLQSSSAVFHRVALAPFEIHFLSGITKCDFSNIVPFCIC